MTGEHEEKVSKPQGGKKNYFDNGGDAPRTKGGGSMPKPEGKNEDKETPNKKKSQRRIKGARF